MQVAYRPLNVHILMGFLDKNQIQPLHLVGFLVFRSDMDFQQWSILTGEKVVFSGRDLHNTNLNWTGVDVCREKPLTVLRTGYRRVFSFIEVAEPIMKYTILNVTLQFLFLLTENGTT